MPNLADLTGQTLPANPIITGVTCDSRNVVPGMLFAALSGAKADGRAFIAQAVEKGAAAILAANGTPAETGTAVLVTDDNPRRAYALAAAAFYHRQPTVMAAITGTNGKTSGVNFTRQIWRTLGYRSAALGTLGIVADGWPNRPSLTTPDPADLHAALAELAADGITHAAMEASSHGLDQYRLDGVRLQAAAFTNLTRDHLDYHGSMETYLAAKLRLFSDLLPEGGVAVINADCPVAAQVASAAGARRLIRFGRAGAELALKDIRPDAHGQVLDIDVLGQAVTVRLPLAGSFQAANALTALGLVIGCGGNAQAAAQALENLEEIPGRLQKVADRNGAPIFVDYAHTPDALETVLNALRPHVQGRLLVVFGCGGDRDPGKRPQMGEIASRLADMAIVTDDNPRSEDPTVIRTAILAAAPKAVEIADRRAAIVHAVSLLQTGDVLVVAGKGHESGQIVGAHTLPFDDATECRNAAGGGSMSLWNAADAQAATHGTLSGPAAWTATGISIDSRSIAAGDLFIALCGPTHDGHDHVKAAIDSGAAAALVHKIPEGCDALPLLLVADTMTGLQDLGRAARARSAARIVAVTGSVGKTGTKEMLALALAAQGKTHWSVGSFNNHWGVPLSLARMPADCAYGVFELGMNHSGELSPLTKLVQPHVAIITSIEAVHSAFFATTEDIADAKAEIFTGLQAGGIAVLPRDNRHYRRLAAAAKAAGIKHIQSFGSHIESDARMLDCAVDPEDTAIFALLHDQAIAYRVGVPGLHWGMNSLAVLLAVGALGGDDQKAAQSLSAMRPPKGRGQRHVIAWKNGSIEVIDESYNASPVSMKAAIATLAAARPGKPGRRIAVLGDMLELGESAPALHAHLAEAAALWGTDLVCTAGPLMAHLHAALPEGRRGPHAANSTELADKIKAVVKAGDVVVVKGSAGSRMAVIVKTLLEG